WRGEARVHPGAGRRGCGAARGRGAAAQESPATMFLDVRSGHVSVPVSAVRAVLHMTVTIGRRELLVAATRLTLGAISLSISSHFPISGKSMNVKPVMFPPGRARLATKPCPTGSLSIAKTIGVVRVACFSAAITGVLLATIRSGAELTSSAV